MYVDADRTPGLALLASRQAGVVTRQQCAAVGVTMRFVDNQVRSRRWLALTPRVVLLHNGDPTRIQRMHLAVLDQGCPAALTSHTSLEIAGFRGFAAEAEPIHLVVPRGAKCLSFPWLVVHESRRFDGSGTVRTQGLVRVDNPRAAVYSAAWQRWPRFVYAQLAAVVQQRVCTVSQVDEALRVVGRVRHKKHMRLALRDIAGGAEALSEIDVAALCRRFGLTPPRRQVRRRDPSGRLRYLDCEWELPDGSLVVLEVDGAHHLEVAHWEADMRRERELVLSRRRVLRASAYEARNNAAALAADLKAAGVPELSEVEHVIAC